MTETTRGHWQGTLSAGCPGLGTQSLCIASEPSSVTVVQITGASSPGRCPGRCKSRSRQPKARYSLLLPSAPRDLPPSPCSPRAHSTSGTEDSALPQHRLDICPSSPASLELGPSSASLAAGMREQPGRRQPVGRGDARAATPRQRMLPSSPSTTPGKRSLPCSSRTHSGFLPGCTVQRVALGRGLVPVVLGVCGYSDKGWCILHGIKIFRLFIFITGLPFGGRHTPCRGKGFEVLPVPFQIPPACPQSPPSSRRVPSNAGSLYSLSPSSLTHSTTRGCRTDFQIPKKQKVPWQRASCSCSPVRAREASLPCWGAPPKTPPGCLSQTHARDSHAQPPLTWLPLQHRPVCREIRSGLKQKKTYHMFQVMLGDISRLWSFPALYLQSFLFHAAVGEIATKPGVDINCGDFWDVV